MVKEIIIPANPNFPETERQKGGKINVVVYLNTCIPIPNGFKEVVVVEMEIAGSIQVKVAEEIIP